VLADKRGVGGRVDVVACSTWGRKHGGLDYLERARKCFANKARCLLRDLFGDICKSKIIIIIFFFLKFKVLVRNY
jgi:hypothetical protein